MFSLQRSMIYSKEEMSSSTPGGSICMSPGLRQDMLHFTLRDTLDRWQ